MPGGMVPALDNLFKKNRRNLRFLTGHVDAQSCCGWWKGILRRKVYDGTEHGDRGPGIKCSDCHFITPQCRAQAVLTHIFKSGRIVPGSARHSIIIEHTAALGETNFQRYYPTEWNCSD